MLAPTAALAHSKPEPVRTLAFYNTHTGEHVKTVYWEDGAYVGDGLMEIAKTLKDHRSGAVHAIEPALLDLLYALRRKLGTATPFHIVSAYRSPKTNAMLARNSRSVAKHSLHMEGRAVDFWLPDRRLSSVRRAATRLRGGGVGYYPKSKFLHLDVGPVRYW